MKYFLGRFLVAVTQFLKLGFYTHHVQYFPSELHYLRLPVHDNYLPNRFPSAIVISKDQYFLTVSRGSFLSYFRSSDTTHSYCKLTVIGSPTTTRTQTKRVHLIDYCIQLESQSSRLVCHAAFACASSTFKFSESIREDSSNGLSFIPLPSNIVQQLFNQKLSLL